MYCSLRNSFKICLLLVIISPIKGFSIGSPLLKQKQCSQFDFQEKILEKMVYLEHSIELERKLKEFDEMLKGKFDNLEKLHSDKMKEVEDKMNLKLRNLDTEEEKHAKLLHELNRKIKDSVNKMNSTFTSFLSTSQQSATKVIDELRLNSTLMSEKLQHQTQRNEDKLRLFMGIESNKNREFEKKLENVVTKMNTTLTSFFSTSKIEAQKQNEKLRLFLEKESSKNKVSLTACVYGKTYNTGQNIQFSYIYTNNGVGSNVTSSLNNNGIFTCEKAGLYMISVFMSTGKHQTFITLNKNNVVVAYLYFSLNGYSQTDAATVLEQLSVGDTLTVRTGGGSMYVYADRYSCLSILQITN